MKVPENPSATDWHFMQVALRYGARAAGLAAPNPAVGCVIARNGQIIAAAHTGKGGRPHAETLALAQAGHAAKGATAYVTLEPCAHHGQTPPCALALIQAQVKRVVVAVRDPFPAVSGRGIDLLLQAGIEVTTGVCEQEAYDSHRGFFSVQYRKRPWVSVKIASTMDSHIATISGQSQWITGEEARRYGHLLRAKHDAILVGRHTALKDDPALTCRLPGMEGTSPLRIVADSALSLPASLKLFKAQERYPTWVLTTRNPKEKALPAAAYLPVPADEKGGIQLESALTLLAEKGITCLLVEGGSRLITGLLSEGLVDEIYWFRAPTLLGGGHKPAIGEMGIGHLAQCLRARPLSCQMLGQDSLSRYRLTALPF